MSKISKSTAQSIARDLNAPLVEKYEAIYNAFILRVAALCNKQLPESIKKIVRSPYVNYINTTSYLDVVGIKDGKRNYIRLYSSEEVPVYCATNSKNTVQLVGPEGQALKKLYKEYLKTRELYNSLRNETWRALLKLGTTTAIAKNWPDAAKFLPVKVILPVPKNENIEVAGVMKKVKAATNGKG